MEETLTVKKEVWRGLVIPALALGTALGSAVAGSLLTGPGSGALTVSVEQTSALASGFLGSTGTLIPLGFAFAAGMVSAVNPCGFSMLPAYLGIYLGADSKGGDAGATRSALGRALLVGGAVTAGFVSLFAVAGVALGAGAHFLVTSFPWIGLGVGVALALAGAWLLSGRTLYSALGERLAAQVGDPGQRGIRGYFLFGLSYGTASLSCTLPIFLIVVGGSLAVADLLPAIGQFVLYGLGMGVVIIALTLSMALFKASFLKVLRRALPYIQTVSAVLLLAAGGYIVYYWLTQGGLLAAFA